MLVWAAECVEKNVGGVELVKALARALDTKMGNSFERLCWNLNAIDGHREEVASAGDNVISGPWDTAG